jgi:hypothetical protein
MILLLQLFVNGTHIGIRLDQFALVVDAVKARGRIRPAFEADLLLNAFNDELLRLGIDGGPLFSLLVTPFD